MNVETTLCASWDRALAELRAEPEVYSLYYLAQPIEQTDMDLNQRMFSLSMPLA